MAILRWLIGSILLFLERVFMPTSPIRGTQEQADIDARFARMAIYEFKACPFCIKVRRFLAQEGIHIALKDAKTEPFRQELLSGGGKIQAPCLKILHEDGSTQWMYESNDIIAFLRSKL